MDTMKRRLKDFLNELDKYSRATPVVIVLGDRIASWRGGKNQIMIVPKKAHFDTLFYVKEPISFALETKDRFIAQVTVVPEQRMDEVWARVYKRLKPMECELAWSGFLRRRAFFRPFSGLKGLSEYIPGFKPDPRLSNVLASDPVVRELILKVRPGELIVNLKSMSELDAYFASDKEVAKSIEAAYYENPQEIVWYVTYTTMIIRGPKFKEKIIAIYDLLDRIAMRVRELCEEVAREVRGSS